MLLKSKWTHKKADVEGPLVLVQPEPWESAFAVAVAEYIQQSGKSLSSFLLEESAAEYLCPWPCVVAEVVVDVESINNGL